MLAIYWLPSGYVPARHKWRADVTQPAAAPVHALHSFINLTTTVNQTAYDLLCHFFNHLSQKTSVATCDGQSSSMISVQVSSISEFLSVKYYNKQATRMVLLMAVRIKLKIGSTTNKRI
jgi:hypothetical protein